MNPLDQLITWAAIDPGRRGWELVTIQGSTFRCQLWRHDGLRIISESVITDGADTPEKAVAAAMAQFELEQALPPEPVVPEAAPRGQFGFLGRCFGTLLCWLLWDRIHNGP